MTTQSSSIAPHEGREVSLVLSEEKPLGYIERANDSRMYDELLDMWINSNVFEIELFEPQNGVAFTLTKNKELLKQYKDLVEGVVVPESNEEYQRLMGRLFGYSEQEIEDFINAKIQCNCQHCRGVSFTGEDTTTPK